LNFRFTAFSEVYSVRFRESGPSKKVAKIFGPAKPLL
jgi:hypothetical protein